MNAIFILVDSLFKGHVGPPEGMAGVPRHKVQCVQAFLYRNNCLLFLHHFILFSYRRDTYTLLHLTPNGMSFAPLRDSQRTATRGVGRRNEVFRGHTCEDAKKRNPRCMCIRVECVESYANFAIVYTLRNVIGEDWSAFFSFFIMWITGLLVVENCFFLWLRYFRKSVANIVGDWGVSFNFSFICSETWAERGRGRFHWSACLHVGTLSILEWLHDIIPEFEIPAIICPDVKIGENCLRNSLKPTETWAFTDFSNYGKKEFWTTLKLKQSISRLLFQYWK